MQECYITLGWKGLKCTKATKKIESFECGPQIYKKGVDVPLFAAFTCIRSEETKKLIKDYYADYYQVNKLSIVSCNWVFTWLKRPTKVQLLD